MVPFNISIRNPIPPQKSIRIPNTDPVMDSRVQMVCRLQPDADSISCMMFREAGAPQRWDLGSGNTSSSFEIQEVMLRDTSVMYTSMLRGTNRF